MSPAPAVADGFEPEVKEDVPLLVRLSTESKASANEALAEGRLERAAELYVRGLSRFEYTHLDEHPEAKALMAALLLNLSLCRLRMDEPRRAHNAATRALALEPRSEKGLYRRAEAALRLGEHSGAEADLCTLLEEHPQNTAAVKLLREVRARKRATAATSKERAARMLASGDLYSRTNSTSSPRKANGGRPAADSEQAAVDLHRAVAAQTQAFLDRPCEEDDGDDTDAPALPKEADEVVLPPEWEVVKGENGSEVWRRKITD